MTQQTDTTDTLSRITQGSVTSRDGTPIAFEQTGEGAPIILVGGAFQHRAIDPGTTRLAAILAQRFTVFHYDRRGRGASGDTLPYAVEREIEDLEAILNAAGGSAFVSGMSSGAVLALLAAAHGLDIPKLALYEPPFVVDDSRPDLPKDNAAQLAHMIAAGRRDQAVEHFMVRMVGMPAEAVAPMRGAPMWPALEGVAHTLVYDATIMGDFGLPTERLASLMIPTLVIGGGESPVQLRSAVEAVAAVLPNAQRRILDGQTHNVDPGALAPVLAEFFAG